MTDATNEDGTLVGAAAVSKFLRELLSSDGGVTVRVAIGHVEDKDGGYAAVILDMGNGQLAMGYHEALEVAGRIDKVIEENPPPNEAKEFAGQLADLARAIRTGAAMMRN